MTDHLHQGPALLCSCHDCWASRAQSSRSVFRSQGIPAPTEPANLDDLAFVDSRQRYEFGE